MIETQTLASSTELDGRISRDRYAWSTATGETWHQQPIHEHWSPRH